MRDVDGERGLEEPRHRPEVPGKSLTGEGVLLVIGKLQ